MPEKLHVNAEGLTNHSYVHIQPRLSIIVINAGTAQTASRRCHDILPVKADVGFVFGQDLDKQTHG